MTAGNPVADIEGVEVNVAVTADHGLNAVALQITDGIGEGFATLLDCNQALDTAIRMVAAVVRIRKLAPVTI